MPEATRSLPVRVDVRMTEPEHEPTGPDAQAAAV
jgi:hypothetical protein